jgi:hypothetical protein
MAQALPDMVADALRDVLQGGWAKYLELEDGTQVRASWQLNRETGDQWLEVWDSHGVDCLGRFTVEVVTGTYELPPPVEIGPEDDGALRAELAEHGPEEDGHWSMVAAGDLAQGGDGEWYEVVKTAVGGGGNTGLIMVTLLIGGVPRVYPFQPSTEVKIRRGPEGAAVRMFDQAGLGPEVLKS